MPNTTVRTWNVPTTLAGRCSLPGTSLCLLPASPRISSIIPLPPYPSYLPGTLVYAAPRSCIPGSDAKSGGASHQIVLTARVARANKPYHERPARRHGAVRAHSLAAEPLSSVQSQTGTGKAGSRPGRVASRSVISSTRRTDGRTNCRSEI